jgi:hypothetical protein
MRISPDVLAYAESKNLTAIATGGGCDYIDRTVPHETGSPLEDIQLVMASPYGDYSPDSLNDKAIVNIFPSDDWSSFIGLSFDTAKEAMDAMADPGFVAWGMHEVAREFLEEDEQEGLLSDLIKIFGIDSNDPDALTKAVWKVVKEWNLADRSVIYHQGCEG